MLGVSVRLRLGLAQEVATCLPMADEVRPLVGTNCRATTSIPLHLKSVLRYQYLIIVHFLAPEYHPEH